MRLPFESIQNSPNLYPLKNSCQDKLFQQTRTLSRGFVTLCKAPLAPEQKLYSPLERTPVGCRRVVWAFAE